MTIPIKNLAGPLALNRRQFRGLTEAALSSSTVPVDLDSNNLHLDRYDERLSTTPTRKNRQVRAELTELLPLQLSSDIRDHIPYIANLRLLDTGAVNPLDRVHIVKRYETLKETLNDRNRVLGILKKEIIAEMNRLSREEDIPAPFKKEDLSSEILLQLIRNLRTITKSNGNLIIYDRATRDLAQRLTDGNAGRNFQRAKSLPITLKAGESRGVQKNQETQFKPDTIRLRSGKKTIPVHTEDIIAYTLTKALDEVTEPIREEATAATIKQNEAPKPQQVLCHDKSKIETELDTIIALVLKGLDKKFLRALVNYTGTGLRPLNKAERATNIKNGQPIDGVLIPTREKLIDDEQFKAGLEKIKGFRTSDIKEQALSRAYHLFNSHLPKPADENSLRPIIESFIKDIRLKVLKRIANLFGYTASPYLENKLQLNNPGFDHTQSINFPDKLASNDHYTILKILKKNLEPKLMAIDKIESKLREIQSPKGQSVKTTCTPPKPKTELKPSTPKVQNNNHSKSILSAIASFFPIRFISNLISSALGHKNLGDIETQILETATAIQPQTDKKPEGLASKIINPSHKLFNGNTQRAEELSQTTLSFLSRHSPSIIKNIARALGLSAPAPIQNSEINEKRNTIDAAVAVSSDTKDREAISNRMALLEGTARLLEKATTQQHPAEKEIIRAFATDILRPSPGEKANFNLAAV